MFVAANLIFHSFTKQVLKVHRELEAREELDARRGFAVKLTRLKLQGPSLMRLGEGPLQCVHTVTCVCTIHVCKEGPSLHDKGLSLHET